MSVFITTVTESPHDRAEYAVTALESLGALISKTMESGEDMHVYSSGVLFLFEAHLATIAECLTTFRRDAFERKEASKGPAEPEAGSKRVRTIRRDLIGEALTKGIDPAEIASAMNMQRSAVENVKRQLLGEAGVAPDEQAAAANG